VHRRAQGVQDAHVITLPQQRDRAVAADKPRTTCNQDATLIAQGFQPEPRNIAAAVLAIIDRSIATERRSM
jgi:hypothetical protein